MTMMQRIGVVGAGQMGAGIAQVAAQNGFVVQVTDIDDAALARGQESVSNSLSRMCKKGMLTEEQAAAAKERMHWSTALSTQRDCEFVVEAVPENESLKRRILTELDGLLNPKAILASNTSSISITRLASATKRADRFMGMHFMNPVPLMQLVELIRGLATSDATYETVRSLAQKMGKTTTTSRDYPGFIANRILMPMINEAFYALMEGVAHAKDIDETMKLGTNQPMGPLTLADFVGLDTCLAVIEVLHRELGDSKYRPCPLLRQHVDAGFLGRKAGRGVYEYPKN